MPQVAHDLSEQLQQAWLARTDTFPVIALAKRLDPHCRLVHTPDGRTIHFSDGSFATLHGRGRNHRIWTNWGLTYSARRD